ncbi:MAG: hypothetical protein EA342_19370 [Leptolyngbya sp. LCM1.Bin17]|nr:MAG: hypothetical protein EA342_19370 [Leptolyngbya sp. LCM1.Bin17]
MMKPRDRQIRRSYQQGSIGPGSDGQGADVPSSSLPELLQQLGHLEERLKRLRTGVGNLVQLQQAQDAGPNSDHQMAQMEMTRLQAEVADFELDLASRVLSWQHMREPFWQAVRFGGMGVLIGWALAWLVYRG